MTPDCWDRVSVGSDPSRRKRVHPKWFEARPPSSPIPSSPESPCSATREEESITYRFPQPTAPYITVQYNPGPPGGCQVFPRDSGLSSLTRPFHVRPIDFDGFPQACHRKSCFDADTSANHPLAAQPATYKFRRLCFTNTHFTDAFFVFLGPQTASGSRQDLDCKYSHDLQ